MRLERTSPCKINLVLNILGKRPDGFHEIETVLQPVPICDVLTFEPRPDAGVELTCSDPSLPADAKNLVHRAATKFLRVAGRGGIRIHLEKRIPLAAGLGGGSGNAAVTLLGLNEIFAQPLPRPQIESIAAELGSDVPFFLQGNPALATGRGEIIEPLQPFAMFREAVVLLIHPGFGISTAWAYQKLVNFPAALNGLKGRARAAIALLSGDDLAALGKALYNSLEAPALEKYPLLALYQEFLRESGAAGTLMSGSGSTTFAIFKHRADAESALRKFKVRFGERGWAAVVPLN